MPSALASILQTHQSVFGPVVPFSPANDIIIPLDFTEKNKTLTQDIVQDTALFTAYINEQLNKSNARYGIGGYGEHRTVYTRSKLFDTYELSAQQKHVLSALDEANEPRRLHLGIDIWGKPHTAVMAPVDGILHSFAYNDAFGDYGATIILTHILNGHTFYTLYGHLSMNSIKNLNEGETIRRGDIFAEFGLPSENGQWPPHLHFQVIQDLEGWKGDYPGVCKFSERYSWLANCPDPDLILQLNQYVNHA